MPFPAKSKGTTSRRTADSRTGNVATIALLAALALIFSYVEAIIPYNPGVPGIKLGIANIVALVALYQLSAKHAAAVNVIRILIAGLLSTVSSAPSILWAVQPLAFLEWLP